MSCDTHKYGYALKGESLRFIVQLCVCMLMACEIGTSVLLYRNTELRAAQYFMYPEWPGGFYTTATLAGSRSAGMIAQTWASMMVVGTILLLSLDDKCMLLFVSGIGEEGYLRYTKGIMEAAKTIAGYITEHIPEITCIGGTKAMIVCFTGGSPHRTALPGVFTQCILYVYM